MLQTERLQLMPLDLKSLRLCLRNRAAMEKRLGLRPSGSSLPGVMRPIYRIKIANIAKDGRNYLFYTYWQIVLREEDRIIGEIGFKGPPDKEGAIEVGYGLEEAYWGKGYMTEALTALVGWAFAQPLVRFVVASTERANLPSRKVLERVGMQRYREDDRFLWWRLAKT